MSRLHRTVLAGAVAATTALSLAATAAPATAAAGTTSLATVLASDGNRFDETWRDFDILDRAVRAVLNNKPGSPVATLADGDTRVTAFLPTDRAFRQLAADVGGSAPASERETWEAVAGFADVDTLEQVLLYHVVVGDTITSKEASRADGAELATAQGGTITVNVTKQGITLRDADTDDENAQVIGKLTDINRGNKQIAHGITRVLRPVNL